MAYIFQISTLPQVMVLNLAHHVQTFLHSRNKPQLSFYEKMMVNKKEEEERLQAAEQEKRLMEFEANKEREENEVSSDMSVKLLQYLGKSNIKLL